MSSFERAMLQYQQSLMPTAAPPKRRGGRGASRGTGSGKKFLVFVLVIALLVGGYLLLDWVLRPPIPEFPARPDYGSATIELFERFQGQETTITAQVDASGLVSRSTWRSEQFDEFEVLTDAGFVYMGSGDAQWLRTDRKELDPLLATPLALMGQMHWSDWVPEEAEKYTSIDDRTPTQVDGRDVTRFDIVVDARAFAADNLDAFRPWATAVGTNSDGPVRFVLYVDEAGIVWRMESGVQGSPSMVRITLVSISDTPPVIVYPTQFEDPDGTVISLAG